MLNSPVLPSFFFFFDVFTKADILLPKIKKAQVKCERLDSDNQAFKHIAIYIYIRIGLHVRI